MSKIEKSIIKEFNATRNKPKFLCNAPFCNMNIDFYGKVSPCCFSFGEADNFQTKTLDDIWNGNIYKNVRKKIRRNELPESCSLCESNLKHREYASAKIREYDHLKTSRLFFKPRRFEIVLSNICNLECIMCNETRSSSICHKKDIDIPDNICNRNFLMDFRRYIPELQEVGFSGGEPFLNPYYYDIWDDIIKLNPNCKLTITTNGTILNDKIKSILDKGNFYITVSFNGVSKETYEAIHKNGHFDITKSNLMYFGDYMKKNNKTLIISICPLKANKFEIPDIIRLCNQNNFMIDIQQVRGAVDVALFSSTEEELKEIRKYYISQKFEAPTDICLKNISEYNDIINRIDYWIKLAKRRKDFLNIFDLHTDKVDALKEQFFNSIDTFILNTTTKEEYKKEIEYIHNKYENIIGRMPSYFKSNHLYTSISSISPALFTEYFLYCGNETLSRFIEEIFYYGLNHG